MFKECIRGNSDKCGSYRRKTARKLSFESGVLNVVERDDVLGELYKFKDNDKYKKINITDERNTVKSWLNLAKQKNDKEPQNSSFVWRLRGRMNEDGILFEENPEKLYCINKSVSFLVSWRTILACEIVLL